MGERGRQEMMQANEYQKNLKVQREQTASCRHAKAVRKRSRPACRIQKAAVHRAARARDARAKSARRRGVGACQNHRRGTKTYAYRTCQQAAGTFTERSSSEARGFGYVDRLIERTNGMIQAVLEIF